MSLATNIADLATRVATEAKALRTLLNGNAADLSALTTTTKTNLVAAINELVGSISGAGATINDATTSTSSVWSSSKTDAVVAAAVAALVDASPTTLDTLNELAAALADDPNFATSMTTALAGKVPTTRTVGGHALSADVTLVKADVGLANVDNTSDVNKPVSTAQATAIALKTDATAVGNTATDFVATFNAGLV